MMTVEQAKDAIRKGETVAAKQDVIVAAYDQLWREACRALDVVARAYVISDPVATVPARQLKEIAQTAFQKVGPA